MKILDLIKTLNIKNRQRISNFKVKGISCCSKTVKNNFIFVAIRGVKEDGNGFINEAITKGAKAIITDSGLNANTKDTKIPLFKVKDARLALAKLATEFYGDPSSKIEVIGVTGTNGKTTITYIIEALLKKANLSPAVIGTINYRFKNKVFPSRNTTPGPIELQSLLAKMVRSKVNHAIIEISSHALKQDRVEGVKFHSAIFTNLTQDHLDYHKTLDAYFKAKAKLFKSLASSAVAVINNDDKYARRLKELTKAKIITYAIDRKADIMAKNIKFGCHNSEFLLSTPKIKINLKTKLIGRHNIYNILAAVAWAEKEGLGCRVIKSVIENFSKVPGRLERIDARGKFSVFIDYAHTEDALKNIIKSLRALAKNKIIVVFGCGGERDKMKRPKMGRAVTQLCDYAIITNDNPRSENPWQIIEDIKRGIRNDNYCVIPERREAIKKSLSLAESGDIVLIAGKGHENYQILGNRISHFDDRQVTRECLRLKNY